MILSIQFILIRLFVLIEHDVIFETFTTTLEGVSLIARCILFYHPRGSPLFTALPQEKTKILDHTSRSIMSPWQTRQMWKDKKTGWMQAVEKGHELAIHLLSHLEDIYRHSKDQNGRTPLSWAAKKELDAFVIPALCRCFSAGISHVCM